MDFVTEQLNNRLYLVKSRHPAVALEYQLQMLGHNRITALLAFSVRHINNECFYSFDVTNLQSLRVGAGESSLSTQIVMSLISSLVTLQDDLNEYLLDLDRVCLEADLVFFNAAESRFLFLYDPDAASDSGSFLDGLRQLFAFILEHFDHTQDRDETVMVYQFYSQILRGSFAPKAFLQAMQASRTQDSSGDRKTDLETAQGFGEELQAESRSENGAESNRDFFTEEELAELEKEERKEKRGKDQWRAVPVVFSILFGLMAAGSAGLLIYPGVLPFKRHSMLLLAVCVGTSVISAALFKAGRSKQKEEIFEPERESETLTGKEPVETGGMEKTRDAEQLSDPDRTVMWNPAEVEDRLKSMQPLKASKALTHETAGSSESARELFEDTTAPLPVTEQDYVPVYLEGNDGAVFEIDTYPFIIGTNPVCDGRLTDRTVSRKHLKLFRIGERIAVSDLGSTNGTFLNARRLEGGESRMLKSGDVISLGREQLTVYILT